MQFLQKLLDKEMDRKEFLVYMGLFLLALTGLSGFIQRFTDIADKRERQQSYGYGRGAYGGRGKNA